MISTIFGPKAQTHTSRESVGKNRAPLSPPAWKVAKKGLSQPGANRAIYVIIDGYCIYSFHISFFWLNKHIHMMMPTCDFRLLCNIDQRNFRKKLLSYGKTDLPQSSPQRYITSTIHPRSHCITSTVHILNHCITSGIHRLNHYFTSGIHCLNHIHHLNLYISFTKHHLNHCITSALCLGNHSITSAIHHLNHYITSTRHHLNHSPTSMSLAPAKSCDLHRYEPPSTWKNEVIHAWYSGTWTKFFHHDRI